MTRFHWLLIVAALHGAAWAASPPAKPARTKPPVRVARPAAPAPRDTLRIETVPPVVIERARLDATRTDLRAARDNSAGTHQPPPLDRAAPTARIIRGQVLQITPTTIQLQDQTSKTIKTLARGATDWTGAVVGDHVEVTLTPTGDTIAEWKKN